jgi:hypothetical protein
VGALEATGSHRLHCEEWDWCPHHRRGWRRAPAPLATSILCRDNTALLWSTPHISGTSILDLSASETKGSQGILLQQPKQTKGLYIFLKLMTAWLIPKLSYNSFKANCRGAPCALALVGGRWASESNQSWMSKTTSLPRRIQHYLA